MLWNIWVHFHLLYIYLSGNWWVRVNHLRENYFVLKIKAKSRVLLTKTFGDKYTWGWQMLNPKSYNSLFYFKVVWSEINLALQKIVFFQKMKDKHLLRAFKENEKLTLRVSMIKQKCWLKGRLWITVPKISCRLLKEKKWLIDKTNEESLVSASKK